MVTTSFGKLIKGAESFRKEVIENKGRHLGLDTDRGLALKTLIRKDLPDMVHTLRHLRAGGTDNSCIDISLAQFAQDVYGFEPAKNGAATSFYKALGIDPSKHTLDFLYTMPDFRDGASWLVPEIILEAVKLGVAMNPLNGIIAFTKNLTQPNVTVPHIDMASAMPKKMGEAERFEMGKITYGSKSVSTEKIGHGISISDEVIKYTAIDLLAFELQDAGRWMTIADNSFLIETLLNGDQAGGAYAAPIIGVDTVDSFKYLDLKRSLIRMDNLMRTPTHLVGNEASNLEISLLDEVLGKGLYSSPLLGITDAEGQEPTKLLSYSHGLIPQDTVMIVDGKACIVKLNVSTLQIEEERIASKQLNNLYISKTIGFYKSKVDAAILLNKSLDYSANGFPDYMDIEALQRRGYKGV